MGPPFSFFGIETFFEKISSKAPPLNVFDVWRRNGCFQREKSNGTPFSFFRHCEPFFRKKTIFPKRSIQFFDALQQWMLENPKVSPLLAR